MATLYAIVYPDAATAEQAEQTMRGLSEAGYLDILDSSLVTKNSDGKIEHHGERHSVRRGAVGGALIGGFTGLIFAVPILGIAAGTAFGSYVGKLLKSGASNDFNTFREQVSNDLQPGGAALLILGQTDAPDRILSRPRAPRRHCSLNRYQRQATQGLAGAGRPSVLHVYVVPLLPVRSQGRRRSSASRQVARARLAMP